MTDKMFSSKDEQRASEMSRVGLNKTASSQEAKTDWMEELLPAEGFQDLADQINAATTDPDMTVSATTAENEGLTIKIAKGDVVAEVRYDIDGEFILDGKVSEELESVVHKLPDPIDITSILETITASKEACDEEVVAADDPEEKEDIPEDPVEAITEAVQEEVAAIIEDAIEDVVDAAEVEGIEEKESAEEDGKEAQSPHERRTGQSSYKDIREDYYKQVEQTVPDKGLATKIKEKFDAVMDKIKSSSEKTAGYEMWDIPPTLMAKLKELKATGAKLWDMDSWDPDRFDLYGANPWELGLVYEPADDTLSLSSGWMDIYLPDDVMAALGKFHMGEETEEDMNAGEGIDPGIENPQFWDAVISDFPQKYDPQQFGWITPVPKTGPEAEVFVNDTDVADKIGY